MERWLGSVKTRRPKNVVWILLLVSVLFFTVTSPVFFSIDNFTNILNQNIYLAIATMGMTIVLLSGGIDVSIGYQISLVGGIIAILIKSLQIPIPLAVFYGIVIGSLLGFLNGILAVKFKVHTLITTLGTMTVFQGLSHMLLQSKSFYTLPESFKIVGQELIGGISMSLLVAIAMGLLASFILNKTTIGQYIYVVGGSAEVGKYAGIHVQAIKILAFTLCGFFTAISTVVLLGRTGSASISIGMGAEFTAITAAILGGVHYRGGKGHLSHAIAGVFILGIISNGMQLIGLGIYLQYVVKAILFLIAISFEVRTGRRMETFYP